MSNLHSRKNLKDLYVRNDCLAIYSFHSKCLCKSLGAEAECKTLAEMLGSKSLVGHSASKDNVVLHIQRAEVCLLIIVALYY